MNGVGKGSEPGKSTLEFRAKKREVRTFHVSFAMIRATVRSNHNTVQSVYCVSGAVLGS